MEVDGDMVDPEEADTVESDMVDKVGTCFVHFGVFLIMTSKT